jgi:phosphohistidine phosphatase
MIYLIRHADAVTAEEDPARPLSAKGRDQVARACEHLRKAAGFAPAELWHSPLARSRETAELLARGLGLDARVVLRRGLEPEDDPADVAEDLDSEKRSVAIVGHEPHLGVLASLMTRGPGRDAVYFHFQKSGILALGRRDGGWRAEWLLRAP